MSERERPVIGMNGENLGGHPGHGVQQLEAARLDDWTAFVVQEAVEYGGPYVSLYLAGEVAGHPNPNLMDGERIRTSRVLSWEGHTVKTRNTTYVLGDMLPKAAERSQ